jgi:hypothetical protein
VIANEQKDLGSRTGLQVLLAGLGVVGTSIGVAAFLTFLGGAVTLARFKGGRCVGNLGIAARP